jgi:hypothetical protein
MIATDEPPPVSTTPPVNAHIIQRIEIWPVDIPVTDVIKAKDLVLPKGVDLKINPEEVIASIAVAKEEVEEAPAAIDMSAIEVEKKGKEDKEGDAAAPAADAKAGDSKAEKK